MERKSFHANPELPETLVFTPEESAIAIRALVFGVAVAEAPSEIYKAHQALQCITRPLEELLERTNDQAPPARQNYLDIAKTIQQTSVTEGEAIRLSHEDMMAMGDACFLFVTSGIAKALKNMPASSAHLEYPVRQAAADTYKLFSGLGSIVTSKTRYAWPIWSGELTMPPSRPRPYWDN